jgi:hypothetical protein
MPPCMPSHPYHWSKVGGSKGHGEEAHRSLTWRQSSPYSTSTINRGVPPHSQDTPQGASCWHQNLVLEERAPRSKFVKWKPKYSTRSTNQSCHESSKMTPSYRGNGPHWQGRQGIKQEDTSDFIEGKNWGPSYRNLRSFIFFSKFEIGLVRPGLVVKSHV